MRKLTETLRQELKGFKAILDIGVGTGRFAKPLQDVGFEVVGVDISKKMIAKAKEKGVERLILADARYLPFKDNTFDAATCVHILHLISRWNVALAEMCRVTRSFTVSLSYAKKDPVRETYDLLLKKHGYERPRPGKSEQELMGLVKPLKSIFVASYPTRADERLANLAQGAFSSQWQIPINMIQEVAEELRGQFAGKTFSQRLYVVMWKVDDLKAYSESIST